MCSSYRYLPDTKQDQEEMLHALQLSSVEELFEDLPESIRLKQPLSLQPAMAEPLLWKHLQKLAAQNKHADELVCFLGAGTYDHHIPSVVGHMISRSEFYTAYTPYQPEISQGELQAIFEFQTMVCELTGMDVANSSMYDGFTAVAEAAALAVSATKRPNVVVSRAVHPESRAVLQTSAKGPGYAVLDAALDGDITDTSALAQQINEKTAAVIVQYPNFFGSIEDLQAIQRMAEQAGALFVVSCNPLALGLLQPPGKLGADIVVGDMQPLGIPMSFGGPHCGYFAAKQKWMRKVPGRIVGQTTDETGQRGFVLTLQAREQHIRRDKASSNICSNQALNALASAVCMSSLGKQGLKKMAELNWNKAGYMAGKLEEKNFALQNRAPFFNEFVIELSKPVQEVNERLLEAGFIGGFDLGGDYKQPHRMLLAVTEQRTKEEIDEFIRVLEGICDESRAAADF